MEIPMKHACAVAFVSLSILFVAAAGVSAAPGVSKGALRGVAGSYSCGFDSPAGYIAPGTIESVHVGGIFTLTINSNGTIAQSDATLSVDDGGNGPQYAAMRRAPATSALLPSPGISGTRLLPIRLTMPTRRYARQATPR